MTDYAITPPRSSCWKCIHSHSHHKSEELFLKASSFSLTNRWSIHLIMLWECPRRTGVGSPSLLQTVRTGSRSPGAWQMPAGPALKGSRHHPGRAATEEESSNIFGTGVVFIWWSRNQNHRPQIKKMVSRLLTGPLASDLKWSVQFWVIVAERHLYGLEVGTFFQPVTPAVAHSPEWCCWNHSCSNRRISLACNGLARLQEVIQPPRTSLSVPCSD